MQEEKITEKISRSSVTVRSHIKHLNNWLPKNTGQQVRNILAGVYTTGDVLSDPQRLAMVKKITVEAFATQAEKIFKGPMSLLAYHDPWGFKRRPDFSQIQDIRANMLDL